jgi:serine/threonine-protein kinase
MRERYTSARDFARDLNGFLFKHARPVDAFDIACLVAETQRAKVKDKSTGPSIIDKLIEEALFEFTSLRGSDAGNTSNSGVGRPSPLGGLPDWASEIKIKNPYDRQRQQGSGFEQSLPSVYEEGNLAALEDDEPLGTPLPVSPPRQQAAAPPPSQPVPLQRPAAKQAAPSPAPSPVPAAEPKKGGGGLTILIITLLVMAAGAAGAWYAGVIPH